MDALVILLPPFDAQKVRKYPDVTFILTELGSSSCSEVHANKAVLASLSEVFETQFFGSVPSDNTIRVEDTNFDAFKIFIDILYNVKQDVTQFSFQLLGDLFYLAEKYQVKAVKTAIVKTVKSINLESHEVLEALKIAETFSHLKEFAETLEGICTKFASGSKVLELFRKSEVNEECSFKLHELMIKVGKKENEHYCENCYQHPCINDSALSRENFVPNAYIALSEGTDDLIRKTVSSSRRTGLVKYCLYNKGNLRERKVLMEDSWEALKFKCN